MKFIGFAGKAGSGKDTAASHVVVNWKNSHLTAFAAPLKKAAAAAFHLPYESLYGSLEDKNRLVSPWNVSGRQIMQFLGTEMFRETIQKLCPHVGDDFWVMRLRKELRDIRAYCVVISDVRFQNEVNWILDEGGIVIELFRDSATGAVGIQNHPSEAGFTIPEELKGKYYAIENNGTLQDLYLQIHLIVSNYLNPAFKIQS